MNFDFATQIAGLTLGARLRRRPIAIVIIIGVIALALAGWAIYSYVGGKICQVEALSTLSKATLEEEERKAPRDAQLKVETELIFKYVDRLGECSKQWSAWRWFSMIDPIPPAYAQAKIAGYGPEEVRLIVVVGIFSMLGMFFIVCVGALLFSTNATVITFALDSVKSLLGFLIGVGMSFMGFSPSPPPPR